MNFIAEADNVFRITTTRTGELFDLTGDDHPTVVSGWAAGSLSLGDHGTHFGFVQGGDVVVHAGSGRFELSAGMYFAIPGQARIEGGGNGFVVSLREYRGFFQIGGPIEERGRLRYIDGCTDSLLIPPIRKGDPCLNLLHIPPRTDQTAHTHPSLRIGMVVSGSGVCRTPAGEIAMTTGRVFVINRDGRHSFHTSDDSLRIVAWHPDSDHGPDDQSHPMLNRTLVDGVPVHNLRNTQ